MDLVPIEDCTIIYLKETLFATISHGGRGEERNSCNLSPINRRVSLHELGQTSEIIIIITYYY